MIISFEINKDEELCYREAAIQSGEDFSQMAKDGAWMRINDIIRESKKNIPSSGTSKIMRFCVNCMKYNKCTPEEAKHCKRTPARVRFIPKRTTPWKNTKHTDPITYSRSIPSHRAVQP